MILKLKRIEDFILNYKKDNNFIHYLKVIFINLCYMKEVSLVHFFLENEKFIIEFEIEKEFFKLELDNNFFNMQINTIEQYYAFENCSQIEGLINSLFRGDYVRKYFVNVKGKVKFLKLVWKNRNLKEYNIKYKLGWLTCKNKIKNIDIEMGRILINLQSLALQRVPDLN